MCTALVETNSNTMMSWEVNRSIVEDTSNTIRVLSFKDSPLLLEVIRESKNYYVTRSFLPFNIGYVGKKDNFVRWDKENRKCLHSNGGVFFNSVLEVDKNSRKHIY